jgi:hypothetical protein
MEHAAPGRLEDRVALGVLHPDESSVTFVALLEIADIRGKRVAGGDLRPVASDKDSANLANPVGAQRRRVQSRVHLGAGRKALTVQVALSHCLVVEL